MQGVFRVWLFKKVMGLKDPEAKPSTTNKVVVKEVIGTFKYFKRTPAGVVATTHKEARKLLQQTNKKTETYNGYPAFMHDLGCRVQG